MGVTERLVVLVKNLYTDQEATVKTDFGETDWINIKKGVRQGCILSPYLFNLYGEYVMRMAGLKEMNIGIKVGGRQINNLRYADDTTLLADNEDDLRTLITKVQAESLKAGLSLNIKKTKVMSTAR